MDIYEAINQALVRADALMNAAEAQGILCGMLCGTKIFNDAAWMQHVLGDVVSGDVLADEARHRLMLLKTYTFEKLDAPEFNFSPLLPDDEQNIFVRTQALGGWCEGFLFGMGLSGVKNLKHLSKTHQEFIHDVIAISRIAPVDDRESNENEHSYMELVEYLRIGIMDVYQDYCKRTQGKTAHASK